VNNIEYIPVTEGLGIAREPAASASVTVLAEAAARQALRAHADPVLCRTELEHEDAGKGMLTAVARVDGPSSLARTRPERVVSVRVTVTDGHGLLVASGAVHWNLRRRPHEIRSRRAASAAAAPPTRTAA
jgi:hypothetical protein